MFQSPYRETGTYQVADGGSDGSKAHDLNDGPVVEYAVPPVCGRSSIEFDEERAKDSLHLTNVSIR